MQAGSFCHWSIHLGILRTYSIDSQIPLLTCIQVYILLSYYLRIRNDSSTLSHKKQLSPRVYLHPWNTTGQLSSPLSEIFPWQVLKLYFCYSFFQVSNSHALHNPSCFSFKFSLAVTSSYRWDAQIWTRHCRGKDTIFGCLQKMSGLSCQKSYQFCVGKGSVGKWKLISQIIFVWNCSWNWI